MLEYARGVNSGSYDGMKRSYDILMNELTNLATALGEPLPGRNPLEGHPDLIAAVDAKQVTPALAVETAMARNRTAAAQKIGQQRSNVNQTQAQVQQATNSAKAGLTDLGKQLAQQDGVAEYRRKAGIVVGMLQEAFRDTIPPQKWVAMFKKAYDQLPKAAPAVAAVKKPAIPANQPMRGNKRPSGDSSKQPKSMLEAISAAFES
jgi:hypothetical protein